MDDKELFLQKLKETISEGRALLKDLKQERKEIKNVLESAKTQYSKELVEHVKTELKILGEKTNEACNAVENKIWRRFDILEKLIFEGRKSGGVSLETMVREKIERERS